MNIEKLIGVGGAALVGAIVIALAGFYLVKIGFDRGYFSPELRVAVVAICGLVAIIGGGLLRRAKTDFVALANALAGAGVVLFYTAFWAAKVHYQLIDFPMAFGGMIVVTAAAYTMSLTYSSRVIAIVGLVGGFLTPILINTGHDNPIGLFGYVLLLDAAVVTIAWKKKWTSLLVLSFMATLLLEGIWIFGRMHEGNVLIGLGVLALFAGVFAVAGFVAPVEDRLAWRVTQGFGVLFPFAFALYFVVNSDLGENPAPTLGLVALLSLLAAAISRKQDFEFAGIGAAAAGTAVAFVGLIAHPHPSELQWLLVGLCVLTAAAFHVFAEVDAETAPPKGAGPAAMISAAGMLAALLLVSISPDSVPVGPWVIGEVVLAFFLVRQSSLAGRAWLTPVASGLLAVALTVYHFAHAEEERFPHPSVFLGFVCVVALLFQGVALFRRRPDTRRFSEHAAALIAVLLLAGLAASPLGLTFADSHVAFGATTALAVLAVLAATRLSSGVWYLVTTVLLAGAHAFWVDARVRGYGGDYLDAGTALVPLLVISGVVVLFTAWPFLARERFRRSRWAWYAAALAGAMWFMPMKWLFDLAVGEQFIGMLPIGLAILAFAGVGATPGTWDEKDPFRRSALAWFSAIALGFVSVAIPLQLDKQWITIGWALEGAAVLALWVRLDHAGLKYFGLILLAAVTARLIVNPAVLEYAPRSGVPVVNWLLYTYLVPVVALLLGARFLRPHEIERERKWEEPFYVGDVKLGTVALTFAAIAVGFVGLNLEVIDYYSVSTELSLTFERMQSRDLAISFVWGIYALMLLGIGMVRSSSAMRWVSLGLLLLTIGKVFLYDLGQLHDFYRVMSLAGLGLSLILVSLAYSLFVFRKAPPATGGAT